MLVAFGFGQTTRRVEKIVLLLLAYFDGSGGTVGLVVGLFLIHFDGNGGTIGGEIKTGTSCVPKNFLALFICIFFLVLGVNVLNWNMLIFKFFFEFVLAVSNRRKNQIKNVP